MNTQPTATTGPVCNPELFPFPAVKKRHVTASFTGGDVTSDGGLPLLRQMDRRLALTKTIAQALPDPRDPALIEHSQHALLRQRIYGLCHGYEDLNEHDTLRVELGWGWQGQGNYVDSCEIEVDRGDGKGYVFLVQDTTPSYTDPQPLPSTPAKWTYRAIFRVGDDRVGLWSKPVSIVVGA